VKVAQALRDAGANVVTHDERFAQNALDEDWLPTVGKTGWLVITKDEAITRRPAERAALENSGVGAFIVTAGGITGDELAKLLVASLPKMARLATRLGRPFIVTVSSSGHLVVKTGVRRGGVRRS
jgi:hypothetical protein